MLALNNTFYHLRVIVLSLGYTIQEGFNGGGKPYGASRTSGTRFGWVACRVCKTTHE